MVKHELSDSETKKPRRKSSKENTKSGSHGSDDENVVLLSDSDNDKNNDNKNKNKTRKYVKWTKIEEETLVRMKDDQKKSWQEIVASGQFHNATRRGIEQVYKRLKAAQTSQIAYEDVFRMWNDKRAKNSILSVVKEEILTRADDDLTTSNPKLETLLGQVISAKGKRT